jgi:hypothetical protein
VKAWQQCGDSGEREEESESEKNGEEWKEEECHTPEIIN